MKHEVCMVKTTEILRTHLQSLIKEYGYSIVRERYSPEIMGNAELVLMSNITGIKFVVDRSQVLVNLGKVAWPEDEWFELSDVVHFYAPDIEVYIFPKGLQDHNEKLELQVNRLVRILRQYCEPVLRGDYSHEDQIKEVERKRVEDMLDYYKKLSEDKNITKNNQGDDNG